MGDSIEKIIAEMRRVESNPRESHVLAAVVGSWADRLRALAQPDALTSQPSGGGVVADAIERSISGAMIDHGKRPSEYKEGIIKGLEEALRLVRKYTTHPSAEAPGVAVEPVRLEWSSTLCNGERVNYAEAEQACAALGEGWRMPTRMELESILDLTRHEPAIDTDRFPDTKSGAYWSSTPCAWSSDYAWIVHFYDGYVDDYRRGSDGAFVRAVRSVPAGQSPAKENGSTVALAPKPEGGHD